MAKSADNRSPRRTFAPTLTNRKARHNYDVLETYEAGIELKGTEVKSIRNSEVSLEEAFARVRNGELWLFGCHVKPYEYGDVSKQDPTRPRKLLLHKREIHALIGAVTQKGVTMVPLKMYFKRGRVKVLIGLARGRRAFDKREVIRKKQQARDIDQALRRRR